MPPKDTTASKPIAFVAAVVSNLATTGSEPQTGWTHVSGQVWMLAEPLDLDPACSEPVLLALGHRTQARTRRGRVLREQDAA